VEFIPADEIKGPGVRRERVGKNADEGLYRSVKKLNV